MMGDAQRDPADEDAVALSLEEIVRAVGTPLARGLGRHPLVRGISTDSRSLRPGMLFVALPGPRRDGHDFISDAIARGAAAVIVSRPVTVPGEVPVLLVEDPLRALGAVAAVYRARLPADVVGVTGSVGKTTTVALAAAVLAGRFRVVRSEETWNAEIGVPLTFFQADRRTEVIVCEMAMRGPGQIRELVTIARPRVGVVTTIGESHLGLLGGVERIADAKGELVEGLPPDGVAILNADDPWTPRLAARAGARRVVGFGWASAADVRGQAARPHEGGMTFTLTHGAERAEVRLPLHGRHNASNALAAAAVGVTFGVALSEIAGRLGRAVPPHMRLEVEDAGGVLILNDAYNASPQSVRAALDVLDQVAEGRRKVAVLGDMRELGGASDALHREVGREAGTRVEVLIAVGPEALALARGAREVLPSGQVTHAADGEAAIPLVRALVRRGDAVLVKGSRAMGLEVIVEALRREASPL